MREKASGLEGTLPVGGRHPSTSLTLPYCGPGRCHALGAGPSAHSVASGGKVGRPTRRQQSGFQYPAGAGDWEPEASKMTRSSGRAAIARISKSKNYLVRCRQNWGERDGIKFVEALGPTGGLIALPVYFAPDREMAISQLISKDRFAYQL
jgi:hypothetical protein